MLDWERRFGERHEGLFVYSLVHECLQEVVIEGDDVYTNIEKNLPPDQSCGWTIALMG